VKFTNSFNVSLPPDRAWTVLMDIPRVAPCLPGAELLEVIDPDTYKGKVAVRLGPMVLAFVGTVRFEERDEAAHTARVKAQGTDSKGRGGANATASFKIEPAGAGSRVVIDTDLNLSGSVAQYGRGAGVIQGIAAQIINQFSKSLEALIAQSAPANAAAGAAAESASPSTSTSAPVAAAPATKPISGFGLMVQVLKAAIANLFSRKA